MKEHYSRSAPRAEAAGLRALKLKLADQSKFSLWGLRFLSYDTHECVASSWLCRLLLNSSPPLVPPTGGETGGGSAANLTSSINIDLRELTLEIGVYGGFYFPRPLTGTANLLAASTSSAPPLLPH